jgi:hypothetical protein
MANRPGVKQQFGTGQQKGEFWDGTYPVVDYTLACIQKNGETYVVYQDAPGRFSLWNGDREVAKFRFKTEYISGRRVKRIFQVAKTDSLLPA